MFVYFKTIYSPRKQILNFDFGIKIYENVLILCIAFNINLSMLFDKQINMFYIYSFHYYQQVLKLLEN